MKIGLCIQCGRVIKIGPYPGLIMGLFGLCGRGLCGRFITGRFGLCGRFIIGLLGRFGRCTIFGLCGLFGRLGRATIGLLGWLIVGLDGRFITGRFGLGIVGRFIIGLFGRLGLGRVGRLMTGLLGRATIGLWGRLIIGLLGRDILLSCGLGDIGLLIVGRGMLIGLALRIPEGAIFPPPNLTLGIDGRAYEPIAPLTAAESGINGKAKTNISAKTLLMASV